MASQAERKARLRAEREAGERAAVAARRRRRLIVGAVISAAVIVAIVVIATTASGGASHTTRANSATASAPAASRTTLAEHRVATLLAGIPESADNVLGRANAPISIIEYGDLECAVCDSFALGTNAIVSDGTHGSGVENAIIDTLVKTGRAKLVYDALDTATAGGATPGEFVPQQAAVFAAGLQDKAWYYIELFYNEQHPEGTNYVDARYLSAIARQIPGLNYAKWLRDASSAKLRAQVLSDDSRGTLVDGGAPGTPTVLVQSKHAGVIAAEGIPTLAGVEQAMRQAG